MSKQAGHSSHIREIELQDGLIRMQRRSISKPPARRSPFGPAEVDELLSWVGASGAEGAERIGEILDLIIDLGNLIRSVSTGREQTFRWRGRVFRSTTNMDRSGAQLPLTTEAQHLQWKLNGRLRAYKFVPYHWVVLGSFHVFGWFSQKERPPDPNEPDEDLWFTEQDAVLRLMELGSEGLLGRIRRCFCGERFFANFVHQKFCTKDCQQKYYRSSPEYKALHRAYMKNLREVHKKTVPHNPKTRK
jgi:hypothetical protein